MDHDPVVDSKVFGRSDHRARDGANGVLARSKVIILLIKRKAYCLVFPRHLYKGAKFCTTIMPNLQR